MSKKTLLELRDEKTLLLEANDKIFEKLDAEKRAASDNEENEIQANLKKVERLDLQIRNEEKREYSGKSVGSTTVIRAKEPFSLLKSIRNLAEQKPLDDIAKDINTLGMQEFRQSGLNFGGNIILPGEVRANILAGTATAGQEIVAEDKMAILPPLVNSLVLAKAGATFLSGLVGDVSIPGYAGTTVGWKGEVAAADDGGGAFTEVDLSPKRLTAYLNVSKQFLLQDGVGAEKLLMENIANAVARKLESTILGVAVGSATQPQGIGYAITTGVDTKANAVVPTWATIVGLESSVDTANALVENLAYITSGKGRGILKTLPKDDALSHGYLIDENGLINGYPLYATNGCSDVAGDDDIGSLLIFANWKDLVIGQWGGYDITVDPYTLAATGQVKIVINAYFDAKGLRGSEITDDPDETTQANYYAKSFKTTAIKAS